MSDWHFGVGDVIAVLGFIGACIGSYFTIKFGLKGTVEKLAELKDRFDAESTKNSGQHEENQRKLAAVELQIARECVKIDDFRRVEDRLSMKIEKIEHAVNNAGAKTVGAVEDAMRRVMRQHGARGE